MLPAALRRFAPDRLRDQPRLRALALGAGLIPPRSMHAPEEAALLAELAATARRVVEIGVYEGASAVVLCDVLGPEAELHLIDPFGEQPGALPAGWAGIEWATKRTVARASRGGPRIVWHVERSDQTAAGWTTPVDLVFIDGDHLEPGVRLDWACWNEHVGAGGHVLFHDARQSRPGGRGLPGPTAVVDELFRGPEAIPGWEIAHEVDRTVVVRHRL
jgi:predicted O-methyltransferase YrrM